MEAFFPQYRFLSPFWHHPLSPKLGMVAGARTAIADEPANARLMWIESREQAGPRRAAASGVVSLCEPQPASRKPIEIRCADFAAVNPRSKKPTSSARITSTSGRSDRVSAARYGLAALKTRINGKTNAHFIANSSDSSTNRFNSALPIVSRNRNGRLSTSRKR